MDDEKEPPHGSGRRDKRLLRSSTGRVVSPANSTALGRVEQVAEWERARVHAEQMRKHPAPWYEVAVGGTRILVHKADPVALILRDTTSGHVVSWPDLDVGLRAPSATVLRTPTGAWVLYRPNEAEDDTIAPGTPAAVHVGPDGTVTRFTGLPPIKVAGASRHGLWLRSARSSPRPRDAHTWVAPETVTVLTTDGHRRTVHVDRRIAILVDGEHGPFLTVHTNCPERDRRGSYDYVYRRIELSANTLPAHVVVDLDTAQPVDDAVLMAAIRGVTLREVHADVPYVSRGWDAVSLSPAARTAAIHAVTHEFDHLADYWRGENGASFPLSSKLSEPRVDVVDQWPLTRVEVTFRHPGYPVGRVRRTVRVFDDAGRFAPPLYASVHLMQDLATRELPPATAAFNGVLDF